MGKLLVIAIDALDAVQVERFAEHLPNIARLRQEGFYTQFESVWPPDSETAWASIYTGWNPARHGIFRFVDPLEKSASYLMQERENTVLRGHTFWDTAGAAGRRVCVLFPHIGYPSWPVNGLMVARASVEAEISVTPPEAAERYDMRGLSGVKGLAGNRLEAYLEANRDLVERQLEFNMQVLCREEWDLCFTYWSALDLIQHQFWAYCDPQDPTFPGDTPFRHVIRDFYVLHDQVIGHLVSQVGDDTTVIVMSDHGHGMRPVKILNINRLLHEHGLLVLKHGTGNTRMSILRRLRDRVVDFVGRYQLGNVAAKVLKTAPWTKKLYLSTSDLDLDRTVAYITDMSGIKAYSYGGIRIVRRNLEGHSYESIRDEIMALLLQARDPEQGDVPLVRWVKRPEDLYDGLYLGEYPDLIFELRPDYGAGWDAAGPLFDVSLSHSFYPGSHFGRNAVFLLAGQGVERDPCAPTSMMDIAPTVLDILDVSVPKGLDGRSILKLRNSRP
jgi:predicted AlkP superfamily phosphohydrolase/phosphomutase